ncbi:MAG: sarcosine oxidase subunit gamma SoxG [Deltaproteobacteria bacterium]|nr:sarcosine oxidase subunit gamma SoxG [Deltaproteobacteria bacterium]
MEKYQRRSPIDFGPQEARRVERQGWEVVSAFEGGGPGPFLIDLSHKTKWDLQDSGLDRFQPWGLAIPQKPGECAFEGGLLINRMNRTQCAIWHLGQGELDPPQEETYTETTDGLALLAVTGTEALAVMERVTSLDLASPRLKPPCLIQGPILHVPCQVVLLSQEDDQAAILFSFSRGYGQSLAEAMLQAGSDLGLRPGGEDDLKL